MTLRSKGFLAFAALILYTAFLAGFVLYQKQSMMEEFAEIERVFRAEDSVTQLRSATFHSILAINDVIHSNDRDRKLKGVEYDFVLIQSSYATLKAFFGGNLPDMTPINKSFERVRQEKSRESFADLSLKLHSLLSQVVALSDEVRAKEQALSRGYQVHSDSVTITAMALGVFGLVLYGAVIGLFFTRLASDLKTLQARALSVVKGLRGDPLPVTRHDEVGRLMEAVNHMASELDEREKQIALERQKYFHQEKMAAIGALAAGVAHEIGNPIAAISGLAQAIQELQQSEEFCLRPGAPCKPQLILAQTTRLASIVREIAEFAAPHPAESELLDLNGLIRSTCSLIRYDKRYQNIDLQLNLDTQLPAVMGVGDQLIQVIMNLLINAADALEGLTHVRPTVKVSSFLSRGEVCMAVTDNGCGMDERTLANAFDVFYTTKPAGKGTGLGLALCKSILEGHQAKIDIDSKPGSGTTVSVLMPSANILRAAG